MLKPNIVQNTLSKGLPMKNSLTRFIRSKSFPVFLIFTIFGIIVLIQHHFVWFYHDDFGYGSLSYAYNTGITGHQFSLGQLNDFLIGHYIHWGGRILYFAINCILLGLGIHAWRIVQTIVIVVIFYCIYKLIVTYCRNIAHWKIALLAVISYGLIGIMVARDGIFWATASVLYLFPFLPLLLFVLLYRNNVSHFKPYLRTIILSILIFVSTFSYEQISVATLGFIMLTTITNWIDNKKLSKTDLILCLSGLAGFLILMLAPGNAVRISHPTSIEFYALPFFERLILGLKNILSSFFSSANSLFLFFLLFTALIASTINLRKPFTNNKFVKTLNCLAVLSNSIIFLFSTIYSVNGGYYSILSSLSSNGLPQFIVLSLITIQCLLIIYSFASLFFQLKHYVLLRLSICALASLCVMIVAPYFPSRATLVFQILMFPSIIFVLSLLLRQRQVRTYNNYILVSLTFLSLSNILYITLGYYSNNAANQANDQTLTETANKIKAGESIKSIELKKLPNPLFGSDMPYETDREYILTWLKRYYSLPEDIIITYND